MRPFRKPRRMRRMAKLHPVINPLDLGKPGRSAEVIAITRATEAHVEDALFTHDCDTCIFLGRFEGADLYVHPEGDTTVIARFGEGGNYTSGLVFVGRVRHLTEAHSRALKLGHLTEGGTA